MINICTAAVRDPSPAADTTAATLCNPILPQVPGLAFFHIGDLSPMASPAMLQECLHSGRSGTEHLLKQYFTDPSRCDNRVNKQTIPCSPDKATKEFLGRDGWYNPGWIEEKLQKNTQASSGQAQDFGLVLCGKDGFRPVKVNASKGRELREKTGWETVSLQEALMSVEQMSQVPSIQNLTHMLHMCRRLKNLPCTRRLYAYMCKVGLEDHKSLGNYLVPLLVQVGSLYHAQQVFNKLVGPNVYSWTSLISGYIECGESQHALDLYQKMQENFILPDKYTFVAVLKACARLKDAERGRELHAEIARNGLERDLFVGNTLVDMYAKCDWVVKALEAFDKLAVQDEVSWNALMTGYAEHGHADEVLDCLEQMHLKGLSPNAVTFVCSLKACGSTGAIDKGREIHSEIAKKGMERHLFLGSTLVDMYAKCGLLSEAWEAFNKLPVQDEVSWTALMAGYAEHGFGEEALICLEQMQFEGLSPNAVTFVCSLKSCGSIRAIDKGQKIHAEIARKGLEGHLAVGSTLVDMYAKFGLLVEAWEAFEKLPIQNEIAWNALLSGYAVHGLGEDILNCLQQMEVEGLSPDAITFVWCLKACGSIGAIDKGREVHSEIAGKGLERDLFLGNTLVDMYAKCGLLAEAREAFAKLPAQDEVSWNALIAGHAQLGESDIVFYMFERMWREGVKPDGVTLSIVLAVCSHTGLVDKGQKYFEVMSKDDGISPTIEHYNAIVDVLGRAGQLDEAVTMVKRMPFRPNIVVWLTVLGACQKWGNVELGKLAFEHAVELDEKDAAPYCLMSNIYADAHMQEEEKKVEAMRVNKQAWEKRGQSWWMDLGGIVHCFE